MVRNGAKFEDIYVVLLGFLSNYLIMYSITLLSTLIAVKNREIGEIFHELDWIEYPVTLQNHFILIIATAQQSRFFNGYGMIVCNLQTFTRE